MNEDECKQTKGKKNPPVDYRGILIWGIILKLSQERNQDTCSDGGTDHTSHV